MKQYTLLKVKILVSMFKNRKLTIKKVINFAMCYCCHLLRLTKSATAPSIVFFELSNRCNLYCVACRQSPIKIYDQNPQGAGGYIPIGDLPAETYKSIIDDVGDRIMMAVLYVNGEPLLRKDLFDLILYASTKNVATMISTNGLLLNKERSEMLLGSGVDFIKIAVSGFTQQVYCQNHRGGDIELVKKNLEDLAATRLRLNSSAVIMLDYIVFKHNTHELENWKSYSDKLGFIFNRRIGISQGQSSVQEIDDRLVPVTKLCDWVWKIATINWDGSVFPCCEFATWKSLKGLGSVSNHTASLSSIWNGLPYQNFRKAHLVKGRSAIPRCADCHYQGIRLQG